MGLYTNQPAGYGFYDMSINGNSSLRPANNVVSTNTTLVSGSLTTCAGGCAGNGNVTFYGAGAQAAGLSYNINTGSNVVQGVAVFKK
jgi:hypothetical protein